MKLTCSLSWISRLPRSVTDGSSMTTAKPNLFPNLDAHPFFYFLFHLVACCLCCCAVEDICVCVLFYSLVHSFLHLRPGTDCRNLCILVLRVGRVLRFMQPYVLFSETPLLLSSFSIDIQHSQLIDLPFLIDDD